MEFQGTKEKWYCYRKTDQHKIEEIRTKDMQSICAIPINIEESEANAKLIAAAPEMFDFLRDMYEQEQCTSQSCHDELYELLIKITEK